MAKRVKWKDNEAVLGDFRLRIYEHDEIIIVGEMKVVETTWTAFVNILGGGYWSRQYGGALSTEQEAKQAAIDGLREVINVGTQLTELERGQECRQLTKANDYVG